MSAIAQGAIVIQLDEDQAPVSAASWASISDKPSTFPPGGGAGGVLSGNYPNPGFAQDMATQAELNAVATAVPEQARDALGAALVAGANITIVPNDGADTITISATVLDSSTDEQLQDTFAAVIAAGTHSGISFVYNDAGNALSATVSAQSWSQITGKPSFAAVATSGSASDITTGQMSADRLSDGTASKVLQQSERDKIAQSATGAKALAFALIFGGSGG